MNSVGWLDTVWQDFRYASRALVKSPGFTLAAVVSLAMGIGANTAVFTVVNAVLLRPLPYPEPERLVRLAQPGVDAVSLREFEFWRERSAAFSSVAGYRGAGELRLTLGAGSEWIRATTVTADFFRTLGTPPAMGREFSAEETRGGGPRAIILSDSVWRRSFGADPRALGRGVVLNDVSYTIVGVLPEGFWFPQSADAFIPLRPTGGITDLGKNTQMIGRLKSGVSLAQAQAERTATAVNFRRAYPAEVGSRYQGLAPTPFQAWLVGDVRLNLLLLFGAVGLLLLMACANLVSLLLTRLSARWKEIGVRLALGSSLPRLSRQFLIENLLLTGLGALAGLASAYWLLDGFVALIPFDLPASDPIRLNRSVLVFAALVALAAGLLFTLVPALGSRRLNVHDALKASGRDARTGTGRQLVRNSLAVSEVALSTMLLVAAGLLIQTLYRMHREQLGFDTRGLITFETPLGPERSRSAAEFSRYVDALLERMQGTPGVRGVAAINVLPLAGFNNLPTQRAGHPDQSIGGMEIRLVTPAYFEAMGIPVRAGRTFTAADSSAAPPVALVNETLARKWWGHDSGVGDQVVIGRYQGRDFPEIRDSPREVVGVVADTKTYYLKGPPQPTVFIPAAQARNAPNAMSWIVRTGPAPGIARELQRAVADVDSHQRVRKFRSMDEVVAATTASSRFDAWLFGIFAGLALALASLGVYGLLSFSVAQRRREIGIRLALGASRTNVLKLVLEQGMALILIGLTLGLTGAFFLSRFLSALLHGVRPTDPLSFAAVSVALLAVGALASYLPARRATRVDPLTALRCE